MIRKEVTLQPNEAGQESHADKGEHVRSAGFSPCPGDKIRPEGRTTNAPLHPAEVLRKEKIGFGLKPISCDFWVSAPAPSSPIRPSPTGTIPAGVLRV